MASEIPPTEYFSGITFNKDFYQSTSSDYLTLATAKSSFLTYPTAQGSETISTLISSSIDSVSASNDLNLALSQIGGVFTLANGAARTGNINIGANAIGGNINFGSNTNGETRVSGTVVDIGYKQATGNIIIGGDQTTGTINIGVKAGRLVAGAINICSTNQTNSLVIPITIGNSTSTTAMNGICTFAKQITASAGIIASGDIQSTGKFKTASLESITDATEGTTALTIGSNIITGNIVIGSALGVGDITIAGAQSTGGTVTIGSDLTETTFHGIINVPSDATPTTTTSVLSGRLGYNSINSVYTIPALINTRFFLRVNGGTPTITLPTPIPGQYITIRSVTTGAVTIVPPSTLLLSIYIIGSNAGVSTYSLPTAGAITFYCPGTNSFLQI